MKIVAIVDTRNMRGQAAALLGTPKNPTPAGLDACVSRYGFTVERSFFSVALPRPRDEVRLAREKRENTQYIRALTKDSRVSILQGELHHHGGSTEEKLVDVLCAVESVRQAKRIADAGSKSTAGAVMVFSQDADLIPGLHLAQEFGVPILAASPGKIHRRKHPFLVLPEPALADLVGATWTSGQELRLLIAKAIASPNFDSWEYRYVDRKKGLAVMKHRHGYSGVIKPSLVNTDKKGELHDLWPTGVLLEQSNQFPRLVLATTPATPTGLQAGTVVGRFRLFRCNVELESGKQVQVFAPNSYLTPGTSILVQATNASAGDSYRYIGALGDPPPLIGCGGTPMPAVSLLIQVTEHRKGHAYGRSDDGNLEVFIPNGATATDVGATHLVSLAGSGRDRTAPFVAHLASSRLPS